MIKYNDLRNSFPSIHTSGSITLDEIAEIFKDCAREDGIPVDFYDDKVHSGGLFGKNQPCKVMFHPDHKNDYFKFCIRIGTQGANSFIEINDFGKSKNFARRASTGKSSPKCEEEEYYYHFIRKYIEEL